LSHASAIPLKNPSVDIFLLLEITGILFESRFSSPSVKSHQPVYFYLEKFSVFYLSYNSGVRLKFRLSTWVIIQESA